MIFKLFANLVKAHTTKAVFGALYSYLCVVSMDCGDIDILKEIRRADLFGHH